MLERQILKLLYGNYPVAIFMTLVLGGLVSAVVINDINQQDVIYWFATLLLLQLLRLADFLYYRITEHGEVYSIFKMFRNFRLGTALTAITLGVLPLILVSNAELTEMFFVAFVFAGLTAGATSSLGVDRISLAIYVIPMLLPLAFCFFSIGGFMPLVMGFMIPFYAAYLFLNSNRYLNRLTENVLLRDEAIKKEKELFQKQKLAELIVKIQASYLDGEINIKLMQKIIGEVVELTSCQFGFLFRIRRKSPIEIDSVMIVNHGELKLEKINGKSLRLDELNLQPLSLEAYFSQVILTAKELEVDHIEIRHGDAELILGNFYGFPLMSDDEVIGVIGLVCEYEPISEEATNSLRPLFHTLERILIGKRPDRRRESRNNAGESARS